MKRFIALASILVVSSCLHAQVVDTTVCDVLKNPQTFNGKIVRIKGSVIASFDQFAISDSTCGHNVNAIWLAYPEGTKGKAGPAAVVQLKAAHNFAGTVTPVTRTPVQLEKSKDFKQFDSQLAAPRKGSGMCLGCTKNEVSATLVGRLDGVAEAGVRRNAAGKIVGLDGFGNMNEYSARLVLQTVSEISSKEADFSKADAITKNDAALDTAGSDPVAAARKAAAAFGASNVAAQRLTNAADAFGKKGEQNGVAIGFGSANEVTAKEDAQDMHDSPDGVTYNCTFNTNRLQGDAMSRAIAHLGQHVYDIRNPQPGIGPYELEYQAWGTAMLTGIGFGQKTLTLPGGFVIWNTGWPQADREKMADEALKAFLSNHELLSR